MNVKNNSNSSLMSLPCKDYSQKIIVAHYHLFKNAGTSIDNILEKNFGSSWKKIEFKNNSQKSNSQLVKNWLLNNQEISAFSSHTALFPIPIIGNISIIPIVFLRHPLDRLWSAYKFERKHKKILNYGIELAKKYDFASYLNHRLDRLNDRACRNFQTYRFSFLNSDSNLTELENALIGLNSLPLVGIVENFDLSMKFFRDAIAKYFPSFHSESVRKNITSNQSFSLEKKLDSIKSSLDRTTYERLLESNHDDLQLYEAAKTKLLARNLERANL